MKLLEMEHSPACYDASCTALEGLKVLVTAGPTQEAIDPVRYISNHSTGKMGYAIAEEMARHGAQVTLVSGPTSLPMPVHPLIHAIRIRSAKEMHVECLRYFPASQVAVMSAAVADYTPKVVAERKIKMKEAEFCLELVKTVDIAASLGRQKRAHQLLVGFALETDNELSNAMIKLGSKNLDMIVLNSLNDEGAAFGHDTNKVTIIHRNQPMQVFGLKSKREVARDIATTIANQLTARKGVLLANP